MGEGKEGRNGIFVFGWLFLLGLLPECHEATFLFFPPNLVYLLRVEEAGFQLAAEL